MKLEYVLIFLIFNAILWSLINSVKNNKGGKELNKVGETSKNKHEYSTDRAESSVNPQIQKSHETSKNTGEDTAGNNGKKLNRREYLKIYRKNNKEKFMGYQQKYRNNNKEKIRNSKQKYYENNKEKVREHNRKYYQKMKNKNEIEEGLKLGNSESANNEGASFVNPHIDDFRNKGKEPIVFEESLDTEEGDHFNHEEEEYKENEAETNFDYLNQIEVEEPNEVRENNLDQINLNKNNYRFDLNEKPEDEQEDD